MVLAICRQLLPAVTQAHIQDWLKGLPFCHLHGTPCLLHCSVALAKQLSLSIGFSHLRSSTNNSPDLRESLCDPQESGRTRKMAQQVKAFATKPEDLSWISTIFRVEKAYSQKLVPSLHLFIVTRAHTHTCTHVSADIVLAPREQERLETKR